MTQARTNTSRSRLQAWGLQKSYGVRKVVKDVHLDLHSGEVIGLLGPNGAGKTTSFYMIVGLVRADAGEIQIDGRPVQTLPIHQRSRMGLSYLPQEASIFRKLNVEENIRAHESYGAPRFHSPDDAYAIVGAIMELASRQLRTGQPETMQELEPVIERVVAGVLEQGTTR